MDMFGKFVHEYFLYCIMYCIGVYDATFGYVETSGFYRASFKIHCSLAFINTIYGCFTLIYEKGGIVYSLFFPNNRFDWSKNWKPELCISSFHFWTYS